MKLKEMIDQMELLYQKHGDIEVAICYHSIDKPSFSFNYIPKGKLGFNVMKRYKFINNNSQNMEYILVPYVQH